MCCLLLFFFFFKVICFTQETIFKKVLRFFFSAFLLHYCFLWQSHGNSISCQQLLLCPNPKAICSKNYKRLKKMRSPLLLKLLLLLKFAFSGHHYQFLKEGSKGRLSAPCHRSTVRYVPCLFLKFSLNRESVGNCKWSFSLGTSLMSTVTLSSQTRDSRTC